MSWKFNSKISRLVFNHIASAWKMFEWFVLVSNSWFRCFSKSFFFFFRILFSQVLGMMVSSPECWGWGQVCYEPSSLQCGGRQPGNVCGNECFLLQTCSRHQILMSIKRRIPEIGMFTCKWLMFMVSQVLWILYGFRPSKECGLAQVFSDGIANLSRHTYKQLLTWYLDV